MDIKDTPRRHILPPQTLSLFISIIFKQNRDNSTFIVICYTAKSNHTATYQETYKGFNTLGHECLKNVYMLDGGNTIVTP